MNFSYIFTFFYAVFIALTITFATGLEINRQQTAVGKTNVAPPKSLSPAKNTLTKENQDRNQRQSVKDMMSGNENIDYSDIDYGVDSKQETAMDNDRWFQEGMKRNLERIKFVQENSNQDRQDSLLFNEEDEGDDDDEQQPAKDDEVDGEDKYNRLKTKTESKKSKSNDQRGNEFKKYDFSFPSVSLDRINNNNKNNFNNFDLPKSGNSDVNERPTFESNFFKAKLSTGKDLYGDSFTDLSGCNQCGKKNSDYSRKNANNSFAGDDLSSAYNEDDKDTFSFGLFDKQKKIPGLLDVNESPKSAKSKSDEENWNLWKFSVAKSPGYKKWNPPIFSDQLDKTKNTLIHEADYKLSKVEQDDSEKKKFTPWKWGIFKKRSYKFNPMALIRLKTSSRLMSRGYGANLPSSAYAAMQPDLVMEVMENHDSYPNEAFKDRIAEQPFDTGEEWIVKRDKNMNDLNDRYKRGKEKASAAQVKPSNDKKALKPLGTSNEKANLVKDSNAVENLKTAALTNADSKSAESSNYQKLSKALDISKEILKLDKSLKALKENYDNAEKHNIRKRSLEALKSSLMENFKMEAFINDHTNNENNDDFALLEDMTGSANSLEALKETAEENLKGHSRSKRSVKAFTSQQVQDNHFDDKNNENNALSLDQELSKALKQETLDNLKAHRRSKRSVKGLKDPLLEDINIEALLTDQEPTEYSVEINDKPELLKALDLFEAITDAENNLEAFYGTSEDNFNGHSRRKRSVKYFNGQQLGNTNNEAVFTYEKLKEIIKQFNHNIEFLKALDVLTEIVKSEAFKEAAENHFEAHKRRKRSISSEAFKNPNTQQKHAVNVTKQPKQPKLEQKRIKPSKALNSTLQLQQLAHISDHKNQISIPKTNSGHKALKALISTKTADVKNSKYLAEIPKAFNISIINLSKEKQDVRMPKLPTHLQALQTKNKDDTDKSKLKTKFLKPTPRKRHSHRWHRKSKKGKAFKPHRKCKHSKSFRHRKLRWKKHKSLHYRPQKKVKRSVGKAIKSESSLAKETNFLQDFSQSLYEKAFNVSQRVKTFLYKTKEFLSFPSKQQHEKLINVKDNEELKALNADSSDLKVHLENSYNGSKPMLNNSFNRQPMARLLRQNLANLCRFQELIKSFYLSINNTDFKRRLPRSMNILNDTKKGKVSQNLSRRPKLSALARQNESLEALKHKKVLDYQNESGKNESFMHDETAKRESVLRETIPREKSLKGNETLAKAAIEMTLEDRSVDYSIQKASKEDSGTKAFNNGLKKPSNQKRIEFLEAGDHKNKSFFKESFDEKEKLKAMTLKPLTSRKNFLKEITFKKTFKPGSNGYNSQLTKGLSKQLYPNEASLEQEKCQEVSNTTHTNLAHSRLRRSVENYYQDNQLLDNTADHRITKRLLNPDLGTLNQTKLSIKSNTHYPLEKKTKYDYPNLYPKDGQFKKLELMPKKEFPKLPYKISNSISNGNFIKSNNNNNNIFGKNNNNNNFGKNNNNYNNNNNNNFNNNNYNTNSNNNNNNNKNYLKIKSSEEPKKMNSKNLNLNSKLNSKSNSNSNSNSNELKFQPMVEVLKNRYLNDLKNFNQNYKFHDHSYASKSYPEDHHSKGHENTHGIANGQENSNGHGKSNTLVNAVAHDNGNHHNEAKPASNLALNLRQQILNCQAFASLEEFLKSLNITHPPEANCTDEIEMDINTPETMHETQHETQHEMQHETQHETPQETHHETQATEEPIASVDSVTEPDYKETPTTCFVVDDIECTDEAFTLPNDYNSDDYHEPEVEPAKSDSDEALQDGQDLKLNISIRAKVHGNPLSKDFYGNGSIEMLPGLTGDDRLKRKCAEMPTVKPEFIEDSEGINSMASGKLSSEVVQAIFKSVKNEPSMQDLVPYLKEPPQSETTAEANLNAIKNQNNEAEVKQAENLIRQAMKAISSIVEANSRSQACQPLRPDLQTFYNLILRTRQEQDIERAKRALNRKSKRSDFSQDIRLLDPSKIKEKTSTVKKLLREYDSLPEQEQQELAYVRDELLQSLLQLSAEEERRHREPRTWRHLQQYRDVSDVEDVLKSSQINYTQEFVKLLKAANFYRETRSEAS